jgi:hypothetical protein
LVIGKSENRNSDKCYVSNADNDPQIRSVANELVHPTADFRNEEAVLQSLTLALGSTANLLKSLLVQANDSANVLF